MTKPSSAIPVELLIAEKLRREEERATSTTHYQARFIELAAQCRAEFHTKQRAAFCSNSSRLAVFCTRRAGKSRGGLRETMARALEKPRRMVYAHETRDEAYKLAWRSDTRDGWRDLIEQLGLVVARSTDDFIRNRNTDVLVNESKLSIDFRNGSQLIIFAADKDNAADKFRGGEKHLIWVDEAQGFAALAYFINDVAAKTLAKPAGQEPGVMWLSGSPHRSLSGEFYEITRDPEKQGPRKPGWDVHEWSVVDNPYFGNTREQRWAVTAGRELVINGWDPADPPAQFTREWGTPDGKVKWITEDTLHVFCVHQRQPNEYGPVCVSPDGFYDHEEAVKYLPTSVQNERGQDEFIVWYYALGVDFGWVRPFAWVLWAFSPQVADIFEMGSWKKPGLIADDMRDRLRGIWEAVGHALISFRADAAGATTKGNIEGWKEAIGMPIEDAEKHNKDQWYDLINTELWVRRIHFRKGSALLEEMKELQYKLLPSGKKEVWDRRIANGIMHGRDLSDAGLYAYRDLVGRKTEFDRTPRSEAEILAERERAMLKSLEADADVADNQQDGW